MASEVIPCPACGHSVRVPDSLFGQPVRCPACKAYFTAPVRDADGHLGAAQLLAEPPPTVMAAARGRAVPKEGALFAPGVCLLFVGILGVAVNGVQTWQTFDDPQGTRQRMIDVQKQFAGITKQEFDEKMANEVADSVPTITAIVFGISIVVLAGSICILRRKLYWLAVAGSVLAIFNIGNACCLVGAPIGIYCLVKLLDPDNRALFRGN